MALTSALEGLVKLFSALVALGVFVGSLAAVILGILVTTSGIPIGIGLVVLGSLGLIVSWRLLEAVLGGNAVRLGGRWWRRE